MTRRRSVLSMPADRARFHQKAQAIYADQLIFDLEDSVSSAGKTEARTRMLESLERYTYSDVVVAVRINQVGSAWFEADVEAAVSRHRVDSLVVPKVSSAADVRTVERLAARQSRHVALELQIENAAGLERASEIAAASPSVEVLHFGPFDFAASVGASVSGSEIPAELYVYGLIRMLTAARASGRQAIDGPFTDISDRAGLEQSARSAARLGYDGKWAIHPDQVGVLNDSFTPGAAEVERAQSIIDAYEQALAEGKGVVAFDGEMVDEATRRWAEATLARAERSERKGRGSSS